MSAQPARPGMSPMDYFNSKIAYTGITANQAIIAAQILGIAMNPDAKINVRLENDPTRWNKVFIVEFVSGGRGSNITFEYQPKFGEFENFLESVYESLRRVTDDAIARNIIDCMINLSKGGQSSGITPMPKNISDRIKNEAEERIRNMEISKRYFFFRFILAIPYIPEEIRSALELAEEAQEIQKNSIQDITDHQRKVREHYQKYGTMYEKFIHYFK